MPNRPANNSQPWARRTLLAFAFLAPFAGLLLVRVNLVAALAPIVLAHLLLLGAMLIPNCQWFGPVLRSFKTTEPEVWLTIDDGPSPVHTMALLDILDRFQARATFFVIGKNAEQYPQLVTEILARGHGIANHTYTHPSGSFWFAGPGRIAAEIDLCAELLRASPDRPARFFRAPVGLKNVFVHPELDRRRLSLIGWSIRGLDTIRRDPARVAERIVQLSKPGAIILLHEGQRAEKDPQFNPRCLELTLSALTEKGYRCILPEPNQLRSRPAGCSAAGK
jgi:peptidoglycan/xylan/chitin deacetylase (PgdA/CDA1 family)